MIPLLLFQMMILLSLPLNVPAELPKISNPGCLAHCGELPIPFPFGIGVDCYLNDWYKVNCSSDKLFLTSINLQVLNISIEEGTMLVNHTTLSSCKDSDEGYELDSNQTYILQNSPFFFSQTENVFFGLGCDNFAYIFYNDLFIAGCYSNCRKNGDTDQMGESIGCYGIKCCQTRIPYSLQAFNVSIDPINGDYHNVSKKNCKTAFLVQEIWLTAHNGSFYNLDIVPVVLDWGINNPVNYSTMASCTVLSDVTNDDNRSISGTGTPVHQCMCPLGFEGNPYLPGGCQGVGLGFLCLLLLIGAWRLHIIIKRRKDIKLKDKYFKRNGGLLLQQQLTSSDGKVDRSKLFNSKELDKATDHFNVDRILGQGGQGTVYKGMLTEGKIIAVKKSKVIDEGKIEEFINEVAILSQINHRNVVKLLGCCLETEVPLLVYEFVPNGTLSQYLHDQTEEFPLTWEKRIQIATEVAGALSYLHSAASLPIYHRDIKSANILLDEKYRAKVADFGTSKSISIDQTHVTTKVQGTFGYLDPEYFQSSQFTDKSDVYSFGVVLVELLTGEKAISSIRSEDNRSLATYFIVSMVENYLFDILDPEVIKARKKEEIVTVANLAKRCLNLNGKKRPTMKEVAMVLEGIQASQKDSNVQQNYEMVKYLRTELIEPWEVVSTSTSSPDWF
ncbi:hypothetical protein LWI28_020732 [Acer negundo]|uniref:Protein kinase domain-containing protein n=1 Tax=Acer negundo TaxID=4023 RepID=A0AAD5J0R4_ACENE|nr:hypothetical protein LWI28_020732 [Acer negundo]